MKISATVKSEVNKYETSVQTNGIGKELVIPQKSSGPGSSVNGGELLLLSLATCFCNDIYREAAKRNISITSVEVHVNGEFGAEGEIGRNFEYRTKILADAPAEEVDELIRYTDSVAEIQNTLRSGINITLVNENVS